MDITLDEKCAQLRSFIGTHGVMPTKYEKAIKALAELSLVEGVADLFQDFSMNFSYDALQNGGENVAMKMGMAHFANELSLTLRN